MSIFCSYSPEEWLLQAPTAGRRFWRLWEALNSCVDFSEMSSVISKLSTCEWDPDMLTEGCDISLMTGSELSAFRVAIMGPLLQLQFWHELLRVITALVHWLLSTDPKESRILNILLLNYRLQHIWRSWQPDCPNRTLRSQSRTNSRTDNLYNLRSHAAGVQRRLLLSSILILYLQDNK